MSCRDGWLVWMALCLCASLALGCGDSGGGDEDAGGDDAGEQDSGTRDSGGMDAGGDDAGGDDAGGDDAGGDDAGGDDAGGDDAGGDDAGGGDGGPTDGGGGGAHCDAGDLIIAEVDPGNSITVFNPTDSDFDVDGSGYLFCQRPQYPTLQSIEAGVTIPAGGSHTFDWPTTFTDTDAGGEVALYTGGVFTDATQQIDFVCWGTGHTPSRKSVAESDGDWSGDCAGAITGDSLKRIPDTDGTDADSYDPTGAAADLTCP